MAAKQRSFAVSVQDQGRRVDQWLAEVMNQSRSQIQRLMEREAVTVNGKHLKGGYKLREGDQVDVLPLSSQEPSIEPEPVALDIRYEDDQLLVINKPQGLVVHPARGHWSGTIVHGLLHRQSLAPELMEAALTDEQGFRPGIVHRLDKDTSGLLVAAKTAAAHQCLSTQIKERTMKRHYLAVIHGRLDEAEGTVTAPIGRDTMDRKRMAVREGGRPAVTHFSVKERFHHHTLLECRLETGRTHQIRVHLAAIKHPIVGDPVYGRKTSLDRRFAGQLLHAHYLGLEHPGGQWMEFWAPLPQELRAFLQTVDSEYIDKHH